ncbi:MAG: hypothetical protein KZQ81_17450, partial [Candidatus Thiodiazotropha sp. (ex Rostrolucina anterorostrata)]|nr:hypothetical protein [Candidatus Thiodiazotropha sp. (ex Rostrolucina anterorostrata)]
SGIYLTLAVTQKTLQPLFNPGSYTENFTASIGGIFNHGGLRFLPLVEMTLTGRNDIEQQYPDL